MSYRRIGAATVIAWPEEEVIIADYETASRLMHNALATTPECAELRAEEQDVFRWAAQMQAVRRGPILPPVLGLIGFSVVVGTLSRAITVRTYTASVVFRSGSVGLTLAWLYLVSSPVSRP